MKLTLLLFNLVLLGGAPPCRAQTPPPNDSALRQAQTAAGAWLALIDAARYEESWDSAAAVFRGAVTRPDWQTSALKARAPFGAVRNRTLLAASYQTRLPGAPPGEYVVLQYQAEVAGDRKIVETVTPTKEPDGRWRVSGYYVPPAVARTPGARRSDEEIELDRRPTGLRDD